MLNYNIFRLYTKILKENKKIIGAEKIHSIYTGSIFYIIKIKHPGNGVPQYYDIPM